MMSLKTHNVLDYIGGALIFLCPFLFGFDSVDVARNVFMASGFFLILYSLFTNYPISLVKVLPLGVHMTLDVLTGVFLIVAPWIFNYRAIITPGQEYLHYILGLGVFAMVGMTREKTEADKRTGLDIKARQPATHRI